MLTPTSDTLETLPPMPISTGVSALDQVLRGGLPGRNVYLLQGSPGTGKTTMALQFLLAGKEVGETCLFVTLSQTKRELFMIAESHGWDLEGIEVVELQTQFLREKDQTVFYPVDIDLDMTRKAVLEAIDRVQPDRLVYDSLAEIRHISHDEFRFQRELLSFKQLLHDRSVATYLIDLTPDEGGDTEIEGVAHGIFRLDKRLPTYGRAHRRIEIAKMRGVDFFDGYHDMAIQSGGGIVVYPRIVPELAAEETGGTQLIRSEVEALDEMLGGGMEAGTTTLMVGQPGTGKSTLASLYAHSALTRGEHVTVFLFEERPETFFRRSEGLGLKLRGFADEGLLQLYDFNPSEISQGQFAQFAQDSVDSRETRVVVIDSFTGYLNGVAEVEEAVIQIQLLLKYLARRGVLTILVVAQTGLLGQSVDTDINVSFLGDTVILLRMYEWPGTIRRTVTVVKKRHGPHDLDVRQLKISKGGISIQEFIAPPPGAHAPADIN